MQSPGLLERVLIWQLHANVGIRQALWQLEHREPG